MHCKLNLTREGESRIFCKRVRVGASCVCAKHVFMCDSQAFNSSGAKAAVKYVCGDAQIHPHLDQNPDSLDIIIIFLPSHWSSSLGALLPPPHRKCQPLRLSAPKQIAAQEPSKLTA